MQECLGMERRATRYRPRCRMGETGPEEEEEEEEEQEEEEEEEEEDSAVVIISMVEAAVCSVLSSITSTPNALQFARSPSAQSGGG
jgi:hypothetical protein